MIRAVISVLILVFQITILSPNLSLAQRLWSDEGRLLSADIGGRKPVVCRWGDDSVAMAYVDFDERGFTRVCLQGVDHQGNLRFAPRPLYLTTPEQFSTGAPPLQSTSDGGLLILRGSGVRDSIGFDGWVWHIRDVTAQKFNENLEPQGEGDGRHLYQTCSWHLGYLATEDGGLILLERIWVEGDHSSYHYYLNARKFDAEGNLPEGWPESGRRVFEGLGNHRIYCEPGVGIWAIQQTIGGPGPLINQVMEDGSFRFEEPLWLEDIDFRAVGNLTPDTRGGFYLNINDQEGDEVYLQHYNSEGQPTWDEPFRLLNRAGPSVLVCGGDSLLSFSYTGDDEEPVSSRVKLYRVSDDGIVSLWNQALTFNGEYLETFGEHGPGRVLVRLTANRWTGGHGSRVATAAEVNIISCDRELVLPREQAPVVPHEFDGREIVNPAPVIACVEDGFFTVTIDDNCFFVNGFTDEGEPLWEGDPVRIYQYQDPGELMFPQLMDDEIVRVNYERFCRQLGPDGFWLNDGQKIPFVDWSNVTDLRISQSSLALLQYYNSKRHQLKIVDERNNILPEDSLTVAFITSGGKYKGLLSDSVGGFWMMYSRGEDEQERIYLRHISARAEAAEQELAPFPDFLPENIVFAPSGTGGGWLVGQWEDGFLQGQKIDAQGQLAWDQARPMEYFLPFGRSETALAQGDSGLYYFSDCRTRNDDSVTVFAMAYDRRGDYLWDYPVRLFNPNIGYRAHGYPLHFSVSSRRDGWVWIITWEKLAMAAEGTGVKLQMLTNQKERVLGDRGLELPRSANYVDPLILTDPHDGLWVVLVPNGEHQNRISCLHFNKWGQLIDEGEPEGEPVVLEDIEEVEFNISHIWQYSNGDLGVIFRRENEFVRSTDYYVYFAQRLQARFDAVPGAEPVSIGSFEITSLFPSPTNSAVQVAYSLDRAAPVDLVLYDLTGRQVRTLYHGVALAGSHTLSVDVADVPSGLYLLSLQTQQRRIDRKVVVLR